MMCEVVRLGIVMFVTFLLYCMLSCGLIYTCLYFCVVCVYMFVHTCVW